MDLFLEPTTCSASVDSLSVLQASTPNVKLYYPEPFIATPSFVHDDIWFVHIVIYQYWLWFMFITIIVFFFVAFLVTIRWCNLRHRPVRETRGVSRSKCGDLITATVPVSWATSIIIHESTDAIELQDGFGSTELAVGIRAYQWGWEYYYPKNLHSSLKTNSTKFFGNSLLTSHNSSQDSSFFEFKSNLISSSTSTHTVTSPFHKNFSLQQSEAFGLATATTSLGASSLLSKYGSKLMNSTRLPKLSASLIVDEALFGTTPLNASMSDFYSSSFNIVNHQAEFLNSFSFYNFKNTSTVPLNLLELGRTGLVNFVSTPTFTRGSDSSNDFLSVGNFKFLNALMSESTYRSSSLMQFSLLADQDFKRWASAELLEDSILPNTAIRSAVVAPVSLNNLADVVLPLSTLDLTTGDLFFKTVSSHFTEPQSASNSFFFNSISRVDNTIFYYFSRQGGYPMLKNLYFEFLNRSVINSIVAFNVGSDWMGSVRDLVYKFSMVNLPQTSTLDNAPTGSQLFTRLNPAMLAFSTIDSLNAYKNLNTFQLAFWKVFKTTLEEERSSFFFKNYSNTDHSIPVVSSSMPGLFGNLTKTNLPTSYSTLVSQQSLVTPQPTNLLNLNFTPSAFTFPFSVGFESDIIRYSWFDWYSTRNTISTKAIDTSVFNLHGSKDFNFTFTKAPSSALLNQTDNFFIRYFLARKLTTPSNVLNAFFFSKYHTLNFGGFTNGSSVTTASLMFLLKQGDWLTTDITMPISFSSGANLFNFSYNFSNNHYYPESRNLTRNASDSLAALSSIISKKAYLFDSMGYRGLSQTNLTTLYSDLSSILNSVHVHSTVSNPSTSLNWLVNRELSVFEQPSPKNPFKPLRKGITNMIRIQADKAVAMPTDTRLQILAVSKDIIHSWSIPSAGIKIDCIPGYSSHRVAVFSLSGIYWGQCMEICGRFHHWMPIVVYFMRRDLFCLWCVHFIYKSPQYNMTLQSREGFSNSSSAVVTKPWIYN